MTEQDLNQIVSNFKGVSMKEQIDIQLEIIARSKDFRDKIIEMEQEDERLWAIQELQKVNIPDELRRYILKSFMDKMTEKNKKVEKYNDIIKEAFGS